MNNNSDILAITNSISYFQRSINQKVVEKEFETHISAFSTMLEQTEKMQVNFLLDLLSLMSKRYYEIGTSKVQILHEEYLQIKFLKAVEKLYKIVNERGILFNKDLLIILISATVSFSKSVFDNRNEKLTDLRIILLTFNLDLSNNLAKRSDFRIEQIYPKQYSFFSNILQGEKLNLKEFSICIQHLQFLISKNRYLVEQNQKTQFELECLKRLLADITFLVNVFDKYEITFKNKLKPLCQELLSIILKHKNKENFTFNILQDQQENCESIRKQLFSQVILLVQLNEVQVKVQSFTFQQKAIITESYHDFYIKACKNIRKIDANIELKKREIKKIVYLHSFLQFSSDEEDSIFLATIQLLKHIFTIKKSHHLITIPYHSTTIPLEKLCPSHTYNNYPNKGLNEEFESEKSRALVELMPFFELQPILVQIVKQMFDNLPRKNRQILMKYFSDELLKTEYSLKMSLTQLYSHIQLLCIINFMLRKDNPCQNTTVYTIFYTLTNKSEAVQSLKASFVEEELLIAITIEIISKCYFQQKVLNETKGDTKSKIKQTQNTILLVQKILNSLNEPSYIIRLSCTLSFLQFTNQNELQNSLKPIQTTILVRNKNNFELILHLLELTSMNQIDYEELASFYMNHKGSEPIVSFLLPKLSVEMGRKCILTVERWWVLLTRNVIEYLNCKEMKKTEDKSENFAVEDGENVLIKNALGVIVIELGQKWLFYLKSQKRQAVIDILISLASVNPSLVFFRSNLNKIIKQLHRIILETLGIQVINQNSRSKKQKNQKVVLEPTKIQFYNRLRQKIYSFIKLIPEQNYIIFDKEIFGELKQFLIDHFDTIKRSYLFQGDTTQKGQYDALKQLIPKLE